MLRISDAELERWLAEDVPYGDLTTHALGFGRRRGRITFAARQAMVAACSEEASRLMAMAGAQVIDCVPSGAQLQTGGAILAADGPASSLHAGWKVSQTLLETASGIADSAAARPAAPCPMMTSLCILGTMPEKPCRRRNQVTSAPPSR